MEYDLRAVRLWWRYFLFHLCMREVLSALHLFEPFFFISFGLVSVALLLEFIATDRSALIRSLVLAALTIKLVRIFPDSSNHSLIEFLLLIAFCITDLASNVQRAKLVAFLRWIGAFIMLFSGLRKFVAGTYFDGAFLASRLGERRFAWLFELLLEPGEFARLRDAAVSHAAGPFAFESPLALAVSNMAWVGEITAGLLLLFPRTRQVGALVCIGVLVGVEAIALELMFGLLALNIYALFLREVWLKRLAVSSACAYVVLLAAQLYLGPDVRFFN